MIILFLWLGGCAFPTVSSTSTHTVAERPTGSKGSKSKSSRHSRDQDLNEEQKDAIVMQNVMNILGQQHNWNRDNFQSRTSGIITGGTSSANTFSSAASEITFASSISNTAGSHSLPGSFLPSGTSPLPTVSSSARKSKSPKSPCRAGVSLASSGGTHKASARGSAAFKASRTASTAATRVTPTVGEMHQQQRQQLHLPITPTPLPLAPISVDALPTGATATVGGQSQQFAVVGGTAQIFHTHPQQHTVFVASGAVHPGLNRAATQNARMAMTPSIAAAAAATGVVSGQQQSAQQTQQQQTGHQQSAQQAYLLQHQYPQTAMQEQYQQVQQQQQQMQQQTVVTAQG
ncbi:unnamed protein product [Schistocephalus solidus]|uniref:Uncharacterized protein n=1 Tax=Schistocephalus solidus TaxID=70667 RepID=A0A3P7D0V1_SCHSO|nr:unnamed protein product [Schistocephalus solidus]